MRDFQPRLCLRIHFYTGRQFFLFLLCPLRHRYDWRGQCFSRFPDANSNRNANGDGSGNRDANCGTHSYGDGNSDRNSNWDTNSYSNCHCNGDRYTSPQSTVYANSSASPLTTASPIRPSVLSALRTRWLG